MTVEKEPGIFKILENSPHSRILSASVQGNMMWSSLLETGEKALLPQVRKQLGMLRHQGKLIPPKNRNNLAKGLILSRLSYLMPLWGGGGATEAYLRKAQVILNTAARWATGLDRRTKTTTLMKTAGWMTIR